MDCQRQYTKIKAIAAMAARFDIRKAHRSMGAINGIPTTNSRKCDFIVIADRLFNEIALMVWWIQADRDSDSQPLLPSSAGVGSSDGVVTTPTRGHMHRELLPLLRGRRR